MGWGGFFDRMGAAALGLGGAVAAPFGLIKDFAVAPFTDDEYGGFWDTVKKAPMARGGDFLGNLFGPDEGVGAIIGGLPEDQVREPVNKVFKALEWSYREGLAEPISTVQYVGQKSAALDGGTWDKLFDTDTWRAGYRNAQDTSPGQNFAFAAMRVDIDDDAERAEAEESWYFKPLSGSVDAAMRIALDPTVVVGRAATAARIKFVTKPIDETTDLDAVMGSDRIAKFNAALDGKNASQIRDQFFPNDINGAALSTALFEAGDEASRASVLRLAMGDEGELRRMYETRADIAAQMERLIGSQSILRSLEADNFAAVNARTKPQMSLFDEDLQPTATFDEIDEDFGTAARLDTLPSEIERTEMEINTLYGEEEMLLRRESIVGQMRNQPRAKITDAIRVGITRSQVYQKSTATTPVRMAFNMRPNLLVDVNDPAGDVNVTGYLRKAGLDKDEQDVWRSKYMAVASPEGRSAVLLEMEDYTIGRLAAENGLSRTELEDVMKSVNKGRGTAQDMLKSRAYDGEGRSLIKFKDDGDGTMHEYPLWVSQTANVMPLGDMDKARAALTRIGEFKRRHPTTGIPTSMLDTFTRYWKPSVLIRPGWPIRVVTDEQMRIMAKVGVLAQLKNLGPGLGNVLGNGLARTTAVATRGIDETTGELMTREKAALQAEKSGIGFGTENIDGYEIESVFGTDAKNPNAAFELSSSKPAFARLFTDVEREELGRIENMTADYRSISPVEDPTEYGDAWLNAVNRQIGMDPLGRVFLAGGGYDEGMAFLKSAEGREHLRRLPLRRVDLDGYVRAALDQVETYTMGNARIKELALTQQARVDDLVKIAPDASQRPIVHGGVLDDALGKGVTSQVVGGFIEKAYTTLGSIPSDALSRHPFADHMYRAEATRLTRLLDAQASKDGRRLTTQDLDLVQKRSREYAISETRKLLYDLAEQSDLAGLLRFISPFYSAWQETMTRWAGLAVENPAYAARMAMVWQAPEKAGLITDENGNPVGSGTSTGDKVTYPDGTIGTVGSERYLTFTVPKWAKDIPVIGGVRTQEQVTFNKKSFNMILQGNPGVGVPVQIPVNEIVKNRPELADSVKLVLPFGPNQNSIVQQVLPAAVKRLESRRAGEEDDVFRNAAMRIWTDMVLDYETGKRETQPTWAEAMKSANDFYAMRAVASYVLPAAPGFRSPYQPWMDAHRRLRAQDPLTADQKFLDIYGEEFFAVTQSFSKSADGVPPTAEAWVARSKYKDLIEQSPELGALIIGEEGAGEYANAIYQAQKANKVAPGSTQNMRNPLAFEDVRDGPNTRLGWLEYRKIADTIDAVRIERGLPNLQVKGAQDLAAAKKAMVASLAEEYPEWYEAFSVVDRNAQAKRLVGLRAIAYDPRMEARPDMRGLRDYFDARETVRAVLLERRDAGGSAALDATSNMDVRAVWETMTASIVEENLAFSDTFYRYLERDDLSAE